MSCAQAGDDLGKERTQSFADVEKKFADPGKELGLDIWIYDENSYPSGFAGGHKDREGDFPIMKIFNTLLALHRLVHP